MFKIIFRKNIFLLFASFLAIFVVIFGILELSKLSYQSLINNGIEIDAEIIPDSATTNTTVNGEPFYSINYRFVVDELTYTGKTSNSYTYSEIDRLEEIGRIKIIYDPETFESIEASYSYTNDTSFNVGLIFIAIFGTVDLVFWLLAIRRIYKNYRTSKVKKTGIEYTAIVEGINSNMKVNGMPYYMITYSWNDGFGNRYTTTSPSDYPESVAFEIENAKYIKIKALGKESTIIDIAPNLSLSERMEINKKD